MTPLEQASFLTTLMGYGYTHLKPIRNGTQWVGLCRFMFTTAIVMGNMDNDFGYEDRWCYHSYEDAQKALDAWDGAGEPDGWHRHPTSGRRRQNGLETVNY